MARALSLTIPPKLYRHFALVTVTLTAGLAMFADGENREAIAARIDERQQQHELRQASYAQFGAPRIGQSPSKPVRGFDDGFDSIDRPFGRPMIKLAGNVGMGGSGVIPVDLALQATDAGYSEEYLASLSEEERELLLEGLRENGMLSPAERSRTSAALIASSRRRGGGATTTE